MLDKGVERRGPPKPAGIVSRVVTTIGRLVVPVLSLVGAFAAVWVTRAETATDFRFLRHLDASLDPADGNWLTWGMVLLPLVFFALNLISRRHGPSLALAAVVLSWAAIGGGIYWAMSEGLIVSFEEDIAPVALAGAFAGAMLAGQIVCIYLFDWLRGIPWWEAPLMAAFFGGTVFTLIFHATTAGDWSEAAWPRLAVLAGLQLIWAAGQLLPTAALRRALRPAPGFGGA
ncbi:MAG: hypothetical protein K8R18_16455 [Parvibaculum sp.]|uniref:hypothetical protein n=1 Tax=Parvibaculum sp. TaxID=2024848 RepID=UPI0025ED2D77|nr:hypothetical protein [Parvibaculum sp.]MCE9651212.1 hypothetical protein [Parvibaculum sp.]